MVAGSDLEGEHVCGGVLMATRILIADDDSTIRLLLRRLLEAKQPDWQVCGEASNGVEAIEGVEQFEPDIVVMDLAMPVMNGLQARPKLRRPTLGCPCCLSAFRKSPSSSHGKLAMLGTEAP